MVSTFITFLIELRHFPSPADLQQILAVAGITDVEISEIRGDKSRVEIVANRGLTPTEKEAAKAAFISSLITISDA